jgi:hypothetical protein
MDIGDRIVAAGCPAPANVVAKEVASRYDPKVTDTIKTISCVGTSMQIYVSILASNPSGLSMNLEITSTNAELPSYMNIGQSVSRLSSTLGAPAAQDGNQITYNPDESEDTVTFSTKDGRIASVRWDWYIE